MGVLQEEEGDETSESQEQQLVMFYAMNIFGALFAVAFVALISGLFLGLLTLDVMDLQILQRTAVDPNERIYATNLIPVVTDRHRLLVTLLILNALAYETLPLFLDNLVPSWVAVLMSSTLILLFGEILPSGIFMGAKQLYLGNKVVPLTKVFLWLLKPVAWPLARWLDVLTETDHNAVQVDEEYNRDELSALVEIQHERQIKHHQPASLVRKDRFFLRNNQHFDTSDYGSVKQNTTWSDLKSEIIEHHVESVADAGNNVQDEIAVEQLAPPLHQREVDMVQGALQMKTLLAMDVYTPLRHVYSVPDSLLLNKQAISTIYFHGYSRVPVYRRAEKNSSSSSANAADPNDNNDDDDERSAFLGFLITRQLMLIDGDDEREISTLPLQRPVCVSPRTNLVDLLDIFKTDCPLLTFVCASPLLANNALAKQQPIPVEAGLMGIITLVDVMESILQDRIYDESDVRDRDRAMATLTRWAEEKIYSAVRRRSRAKGS